MYLLLLLLFTPPAHADPPSTHIVLVLGRDAEPLDGAGSSARAFRQGLDAVLARPGAPRVTYSVVTEFTGVPAIGLNNLPAGTTSVHVIFAGHGVPRGGQLALGGAGTAEIPANAIGDALAALHRNSGIAGSASFLCCHAGLVDRTRFPGSVFGMSPGDALMPFTTSITADILPPLLRLAAEGRVPAPLDAAQFHRAWQQMDAILGRTPDGRMMSIRGPHSDITWLSEGPTGNVHGMQMIGLSQTPLARAFRRMIAGMRPPEVAARALALSFEHAARQVSDPAVRESLLAARAEILRLPPGEQASQFRLLLDQWDTGFVRRWQAAPFSGCMAPIGAL